MSYKDDMLTILDREIEVLTGKLGEATALRELLTEGEGVTAVAPSVKPSAPKPPRAEPKTIPERMRQILSTFSTTHPMPLKEVADKIDLSLERTRELAKTLEEAGRLRVTEPAAPRGGTGGKTPALYVRVPILDDSKKEKVITWP